MTRVAGGGSRSRAADLGLGARLAVSGGRPARLRALMTALGVGLGVMLLLVAASTPAMIERGRDRDGARGTDQALSAKQTHGRGLLIATSDTRFRGDDIRGRDVEPEPRAGSRAPRPPGVSRLPGPGEIVVSPKLRTLLGSDGGTLLRERLHARVVGTIGDAGLHGPAEFAFYRGSDTLSKGGSPRTLRVTHFGVVNQPDSLGPFLTLLVAIAVVVLLLPIAVFIGAAVRFGGEDRDRRLAALRLVGADRAMAARIAAGETLLGALLGLVAGVGLFLAARPLMAHVSLEDISFFASDVRPAPVLAVLVLVLVPVSAVVVSLLALRRVVVEPLGVVRRAADAKRALWWRLIPAVIGVAVIVPLHGDLGRDGAEYQAAVGVLLVLVGITAILPWLVERCVRRLHGGPLGWQLATRRLQMDGGTAARVVSGIAVAVAGAIALQTIFTAAERTSTFGTGGQPARADVAVYANGDRGGVTAASLAARLRRTDGVRRAFGTASVFAEAPSHVSGPVYVGGCAALREYAAVGACRNGDVFLARGGADRPPRRGDLLRLGDPVDGVKTTRWRVPASARAVSGGADPSGVTISGVLATPGALSESRLPNARLEVFARVHRSDRDAVERVRNVAAAADPAADVLDIHATTQVRAFGTVRRGIFAGAVAVLVLIGASLLVGALEQLRERRRVLAVLVAFGTRRTTLATSVLWQTAVPVVLGLAVSVVVGASLGALLLSVADEPVILDWGTIVAMAGAGGVVVLIVTALSMPALWRLMRPDGLRTE